MSWISSLTDWFSPTSSLHNVTVQVDHVVDKLSSTTAKYAGLALLMGVAATDVAQAQTKDGEAPVTVPVIEAVEQDDVEDVYQQAQEINADDSFDPEDGPREVHHAKDLIAEFEDVGEEIERLIDNGETTEATMLLKTVATSLENTSKNLTRLLASAKQANKKDADFINALETLTEDLTSLRDNIDTEQNRLAKSLGALEDLKKEIDNDSRITSEESNGEFTMRITMKGDDLLETRADVTELLDDYLGGKGLEGKTFIDSTIPDGDEKIEVTAVTTITYK